MSSAARRGALLLVPNALDLGAPPRALTESLPDAVLCRAASLAFWVVEDARSARGFLKRVDAVVPLAAPLQGLSIRELPRPAKGAPVARPGRSAATAAPAVNVWLDLLAPAFEGHDIGLLSEAGLPAVADPGSMLVAAAHDTGLAVLPLPGPSSLLLALAASGLNGNRFAFVGYLPQEAASRAARIRDLERASRANAETQIAIETPYRNPALLAALVACLEPRTRLAVSCGVTLPDGFSRSATVAQWRAEPTPVPDRVPAVFLWLAA